MIDSSSFLVLIEYKLGTKERDLLWCSPPSRWASPKCSWRDISVFDLVFVMVLLLDGTNLEGIRFVRRRKRRCDEKEGRKEDEDARRK